VDEALRLLYTASLAIFARGEASPSPSTATPEAATVPAGEAEPAPQSVFVRIRTGTPDSSISVSLSLFYRHSPTLVSRMGCALADIASVRGERAHGPGGRV